MASKKEPMWFHLECGGSPTLYGFNVSETRPIAPPFGDANWRVAGVLRSPSLQKKDPSQKNGGRNSRPP
jgi:hypothetical protein